MDRPLLVDRHLFRARRLCARGKEAGMRYKQTATSCIVRLVTPRGLSPATRAQCQALRQEAGRLWTAVDGCGRLW